MTIPLGSQNAAPGETSWKTKRSSSRPSFRWSRFLASSSRHRYLSRSSRLSQDVGAGVAERRQRRRLAVGLPFETQVSIFFTHRRKKHHWGSAPVMLHDSMVGSGGLEQPNSSSAARGLP